MPSLNLKTKSIRYSKADMDLMSACAGLCNTMIEYDAQAEALATKAFPLLDGLWQHIQRLRDGRGPVPAPKPKQ